MKPAEIELAAYAKVYELFLGAPIRSAFREAADGPDGEPPPTDPEMLVAVQADRFDLMSRLRELRREAQQELALDVPALSDDRFCELWEQARDGTPDGMCGHVQVRQFSKLLYAELGITSHGPWPLGWVPAGVDLPDGAKNEDR